MIMYIEKKSLPINIDNVLRSLCCCVVTISEYNVEGKSENLFSILQYILCFSSSLPFAHSELSAASGNLRSEQILLSYIHI